MDYAPQLATLVKEPPRGDEWIHEIKFDGYRIGCRIRKGRATLDTETASWHRLSDAIGLILKMSEGGGE